jgi:hypothetical protein
LIASQKTLLSQVSEIVPSNDVIIKGGGLDRKTSPRLMVIFGDSLSIVYDAVDYLHRYYDKFGVYPKIVCLPGSSLSKHVNFGKPVETWMKIILLDNGIPEDAFYQDLGSSRDVICTLGRVFNATRCSRVAVFAARGYSVSTILMLQENFPEISFKFFAKAYVSSEYMEEYGMRSNCIFDTDCLDSLGIDLILGELVRLHLMYDALPVYLKRHLMPLEKVKKFTDKGYILGLNTEEEINAVGLSVQEFVAMVPERLCDFDWIDNVEERIYGQILSLKD